MSKSEEFVVSLNLVPFSDTTREWLDSRGIEYSVNFVTASLVFFDQTDYLIFKSYCEDVVGDRKRVGSSSIMPGTVTSSKIRSL